MKDQGLELYATGFIIGQINEWSSPAFLDLAERLKDRKISAMTVKELMNEITEAKNVFNQNRGAI